MKVAKTKPALTCSLGALIASVADAGIIYVANPINVSATGATGLDTAPWDIDNDTMPDALLAAYASATEDLFGFKAYSGKLSIGHTNGYAISFLVEYENSVVRISTLQSITANGYVGPGEPFVTNNFQATIQTGSIGNNALKALNPDNAYIGFKFNDDQYGIANLSYRLTDQNSVSLTIKGWWYNDTSGQGIYRYQIPEPETAGLGLAVLAAGAAGLRSWRKRKQAG